MKHLITSLLTAGLLLGASHAEESGSMLSNAEKFAKDSKASMLKAKDKAAEVGQQATAVITKADDVLANLSVSLDDIKKQVASLDKTQLLAYAEKYKALFAEKEALISSTTSKLKELSWLKKMGSEGKALKQQLSGYTEQLKTLKQQYSVYTDQLKTLGVDLSAYGL